MIHFCTLRSSPQRLHRFKEKLPPGAKGLTLILDVRTRWSSTHQMLARALHLQDAYVSVCNVDDDLTAHKLTTKDWDYLKNLVKLLEPMADLTRQLSASRSHCTIAHVTGAYNHMTSIIEQYVQSPDNNRHFPDICKAAKAAHSKLRKYYSSTDLTPIYSVATAMHPDYKLDWWAHAGWDHYADQAVEMVHEVSRKYDVIDLAQELPIANNIAGTLGRPWLKPQSRPLGTDLDRYAKDDEPTGDSELTWWQEQEGRYPKLVQMAKDYLAIPATSTPSERCFSQARLVLPHTRNRLGPTKVKELILLEAWFRYFN